MRQITAVFLAAGCLLLLYRGSQVYDLQQDAADDTVRFEAQSAILPPDDDEPMSASLDREAEKPDGRYRNDFSLKGMVFDRETKMGDLRNEWSAPFTVSVVRISRGISDTV